MSAGGSTTTTTTTTFDAKAKESQLRQEAESWDYSNIAKEAQLRDIPILDLTLYLQDPANIDVRQTLAKQLQEACETVGFFTLIGHGIVDPALTKRLYNVMNLFFNQDDDDMKHQVLMDRKDFPIKGVGYLPLYNRKLPTRSTPNANEAYVVKQSHDITWDDNPWPSPSPSSSSTPSFDATEFRTVVEEYGRAMETLARSLLPLFAIALDMEANYFDQAFEEPFYRLRMTRYPPAPPPPTIDQDKEEDNNNNDSTTTTTTTTTTAAAVVRPGILPHVDTSFFTILAQSQPGLIIFDERCKNWIRVPLIKQQQQQEQSDTTTTTTALVVNVGELLRQWTNDRFQSVKHFAINDQQQQQSAAASASASSRYSVPFFWNANADYIMKCIPSCCDDDDDLQGTNPSKYPPISYNMSQAKAQGE